jgi:hypothetical protein
MRSGLIVAMGLVLLGAAAPAGAQAAAEPVPVTMRPDDSEMLQDAATVVVVSPLEHQGDLSAKLFGAASGDPAMNGLNTYLAFFEPPPVNGWRIFEIGDFLTYTIVAETPGRLLLEIHESDMHDNGEIGERTRRLAISWTPGRDGAPPATVTVATAPPNGAATPQGH